MFKNFLKLIVISIAFIMFACSEEEGAGGSVDTDNDVVTPPFDFDPTEPKWSGENYPVTSQGDIYEIDNGSHLAWIVIEAETNPNIDNFAGKTIKFMKDIDMDNRSFKGIKEFSGSIDGNGKGILNLKIDGTTRNTGLIHLASGTVSIDNLTIYSGEITGTSHVGSFVGVAGSDTYGSDTLIIRNSVNNATVTGTDDQVGGLIGGGNEMTIIIDNSSNTGNVANSSAEVGGLIGYVFRNITITNSSNTGDVNGTGTFVGGLVGNVEGTIILTNSHSYAGSVTGSQPFLGGILGGHNLSTYTLNNVYWLYDATATTGGGIKKGFGVGGDAGNNKEFNKAMFKEKKNFQGWDFVDIWEMGDDYPTLIKP